MAATENDPLEYRQKHGGYLLQVRNQPSIIVATARGIERGEQQAYAQRLTACWNACLGIALEALQADPDLKALRSSERKDAVGALLKAAKQLLQGWEATKGEVYGEDIKALAAVISQIEGKTIEAILNEALEAGRARTQAKEQV